MNSSARKATVLLGQQRGTTNSKTIGTPIKTSKMIMIAAAIPPPDPELSVFWAVGVTFGGVLLSVPVWLTFEVLLVC